MRARFLKMTIEHLNKNYAHISHGNQSIWFDTKEKVVALMDNGELEIVFDILKEAVLP
jgi:hypothetical protein